MKKSVAFAGILVILFLFTFVHAENDALAGDVQKAGTEVQQKLMDVPEGFQEQSNEVLERNVNVPGQYAFIASLFGVKQGIDLQRLIVLLCLWLLLFLVLRQVLEVVPFFGEGWQSWAGGVVITMLAALSGGLNEAANFFFHLGGLFGVLREQSLFQVILSIVVLLFFFTLMSKIAKIFARQMHKAKAEALGETLAQGAKSAEVLSKGVEKLGRARK